MATIHISEADAARDLPALLAQVRAGTEIIIESGAAPIAVLRQPTETQARSLPEIARRARRREQESGEVPVIDADFAADVDLAISSRQPWTPPAWD